jgi:multidrug resistance efflux pump
VELEALELNAEKSQLQARKQQAQAALSRLTTGYRPEEVVQAEANASREEAQLQALRNGARPQEIAQADAELAAARADAANAEGVWQRLSGLRQTGDVSAQVADDAASRRDATAQHVKAAEERVALLRAGTRREDLEAAGARVAQAKANANQLRSGYRKEDVAEARGRLAEIEGQIQSNADRLAEMQVHSPVRARLDTVSVRPGDVVPANRVVASLLEPSQIWVRAYVPEPRLASVKVGQKVTLELDSNQKFPGEVVQISTQAEFLPRNVQTREDRDYQLFAIRVRPLQGLDVLKPGMAVAVKLE